MSDGRRSRTEVVPEVVFLGKLVERIAEGKIRVPRFQRAFVWRQTDLHALLDSILRGFPIGSILVWDTEENIGSASCIGPMEISPRPDGMIGYLLDGQQRVSTLVGTLRFDRWHERNRGSSRLARVLQPRHPRISPSTARASVHNISRCGACSIPPTFSKRAAGSNRKAMIPSGAKNGWTRRIVSQTRFEITSFTHSYS